MAASAKVLSSQLPPTTVTNLSSSNKRHLGILRFSFRRLPVGSASILAAIDNGSVRGKSTASAVEDTAVLRPNYVVPFDKTPTLTRPLEEILRDLNNRLPDNLVKNNSISWYHANRMLSFYAPGWCGEIRDIVYSNSGSVTVIYRVTVRGTNGEVHREATGTVNLKDGKYEDPIAKAEEISFCKACARFGLGLHLYHEDC